MEVTEAERIKMARIITYTITIYHCQQQITAPSLCLVCRMQGRGWEKGEGGHKVMLRKLSSGAGHNELPTAASDGPGICK